LEILKSLSEATSELVQKLSPSVVNVKTRMTGGTGVVLSPDGYIVTCNHVLGRCAQVRVGIGEKTVDAKTVGFDPYSDVALLKAQGPAFKPVELGDSNKLSTGQFVIALANPFNRTPTATTGIITNASASLRGWRSLAMDNVIATDAKLNPGFSGGPLVDVSGKMIGLNTAYVWQRGIAIPVNRMKSITDRLISGGELKRAYLGIVSDTVRIPRETADQAQLDQDTGVMIFQVEQGTPARKAGLTMGDVIVSFNQKPVTAFYDLPRLLTEDLIGKKTTVKILRGEQIVELTITPSEAEMENDE
jgi:S1-C subfamily serine protease